jgi:hypothetical protein
LEWEAKGEIPEMWDERVGLGPLKRSQPGFRGQVVWHRLCAAFVSLFACLCLISAVLQIFGMFP